MNEHRTAIYKQYVEKRSGTSIIGQAATSHKFVGDSELYGYLSGGWERFKGHTRPKTEKTIHKITASEVSENFKRAKKIGPFRDYVARPKKEPVKLGISNTKFTYMGHGKPVKLAKRSIPSPIRKGGGILGKLSLAAVGIFNISMMKNVNKMNGFGRYMKNMAASKNVLGPARIGATLAGASLGTAGLSIALSKTRHG